MFCKKKVFLEISRNSQENNCARVSEPETCNFIKRKTPAQVFSCEFWEIFKNTVLTEHLWATASVRRQTTDIINIINVVPVSLFLTLNSYQHLL